MTNDDLSWKGEVNSLKLFSLPTNLKCNVSASCPLQFGYWSVSKLLEEDCEKVYEAMTTLFVEQPHLHQVCKTLRPDGLYIGENIGENKFCQSP